MARRALDLRPILLKFRKPIRKEKQEKRGKARAREAPKRAADLGFN